MNGEFLNESVGLLPLRRYIYFTETKQPLTEAVPDDQYYLGTHADAAYYFYYERDSVTTLNLDFLHTVKATAASYVIYADLVSFSAKELAERHITFRKIPRDIKRL